MEYATGEESSVLWFFYPTMEGVPRLVKRLLNRMDEKDWWLSPSLDLDAILPRPVQNPMGFPEIRPLSHVGQYLISNRNEQHAL
jgi:hypothetical protein